MKTLNILLMSVVLMFIYIAGCGGGNAPTVTTPVVPEAGNPYTHVFNVFMEDGYEEDIDVKFTTQICSRLEYWAEVAEIEHTIPSLYALAYQESKFGLEIAGTAGETDFGQIAPRWRSHYEGVRTKLFPSVKLASVDGELALFVAAYWECMRIAKGNENRAIRWYTGSDENTAKTLEIRSRMFR